MRPFEGFFVDASSVSRPGAAMLDVSWREAILGIGGSTGGVEGM